MRIVLPTLNSLSSSFGRLAGALVLSAGVLAASASGALAKNEKYAGFVIDANNGNVLYEDRADAPRYPASLTKMMTLYMLFDALRSNRVELDTKMKVSSYAAARPPSKLGLKPGSYLTVEEGIYSLVTKSANDAATVIGEHLAGTETRFAQAMTRQAHKLGMSNTTFKNAHGLPDREQKTTARDMAKLGLALREHFPEYYDYFSTRSYSFRGRRLGNHNRVLGRVKGADGIKTGYINASGFNLVTSVQRDGKSIVAVVMGGRSGRSRDDHMVDLISRTLPKASVRDSGPLIAAAKPTAYSYGVPKTPPIPEPRPMAPTSIDERIAMAYGSDAAGAVPMSAESSKIVGLSALAAALVQERPMSNLAIPAASAGYGNSQKTAALDRSMTGSLAAVRSAGQAAPTSSWVVQIAATPEEREAMSMLNAAKSKVGRPLAAAEPYTQSISSNGQTLYRARFAGFDNKDEAWAACAALKRSDYNCYAVAN